jgi:hypothetical protein
MQKRELNAAHLRIGNFISKNGKEIILHSLSADLTDCEPILIDAQWLVNFGFKQERYENSFQALYFPDSDDPSIVLEIFVNIENKEVRLIKDDGEETLLPIEMLYVHQLQNLFFAVTGIELIKEEVKVEIRKANDDDLILSEKEQMEINHFWEKQQSYAEGAKWMLDFLQKNNNKKVKLYGLKRLLGE